MFRPLLLTLVALLCLPPAASADFRVFEENAPEEDGDDDDDAADDDPAHDDPADEEDEAPTPPRTGHENETIQLARPPVAAPPLEDGPAVEVEVDGSTVEGSTVEGGPEGTTVEGTVSGESTGTEIVPPPPTSTEVASPSTNSETPETPSTDTPPPDLAADLLDDHRWLDITSFVQPGFIVRLDNEGDGISAGVTDDTFWLQRARIGLRAQLFAWLRARIEVEFAPVTLLQDAFLDIQLHEYLTVRVGQMLVPFLQTFRFNELNIMFLDRAIYTPQRPDREFIRYLSPRDVGISLNGRIGNSDPESHDPVLEYAAGLFVGRGPNIALNDDGVFLWAARLQLHFLGIPHGADRETDLDRNHHARVALGFGAYSNCDDRSNWNRGFTTDLEMRFEGLYASAGFVWIGNSGGGQALLSDSTDCRGQPTGMTNPDGTPIALRFVSRGAHLQAQYALPRLFDGIFSAPFDGMTVELLARLDWVDPNSPWDDSDPLFGGGPDSEGYNAPSNFTDSDNAPTRWRLTFGINYYPTGEPRLRLGINYQLNREEEEVVTGTGRYAGVSNDILWIQITAGL